MHDLYGRNGVLRQQLDDAPIEYYGDFPDDTRVYLTQPEVVYPLTERGKPSKNPKIMGHRHIRYRNWDEIQLSYGKPSVCAQTNSAIWRQSLPVTVYG